MKLQMRSLSLAGIKKNPALIPLFAIMIGGGLMATYYLARLAIRNPDVTWRRKTNPEPWQHYANKQYKFMSSIDHSTYEHPRPKF